MKKYLDFYKKYGYIPEMFNPYNCREIKGICPTITTNCISTTNSSAVLIIEEKDSCFYQKENLNI